MFLVHWQAGQLDIQLVRLADLWWPQRMQPAVHIASTPLQTQPTYFDIHLQLM